MNGLVRKIFNWVVAVREVGKEGLEYYLSQVLMIGSF